MTEKAARRQAAREPPPEQAAVGPGCGTETQQQRRIQSSEKQVIANRLSSEAFTLGFTHVVSISRRDSLIPRGALSLGL